MNQQIIDSFRARLLLLLTTRSYAKKNVILASGKESDFFIDCKQTILSSEGHLLAGSLLLDMLCKLDSERMPAAVAGVELGGCPLASAVSCSSFAVSCSSFGTLQLSAPLDAIYVRKSVKDHGSKRLLEGNDNVPMGSRVVLLEDVVTSGGSSLRAAQVLCEGGYVVEDIFTLVDRLEGARETLHENGIELTSLFTREDFPR